MLNKITRFFLLLLLSATCSFAHTSGWEEELAKKVADKLNQQIVQNTLNEKRGEKQKNIYVVSLSEVDWDIRKDWVDERGEQGHQIFNDGQLEAFNTQLRLINEHDKLSNAKSAMYVVIINNWKLYLETTISPFDKITNFSQFSQKAKESSFKDIKDKMASVPHLVETEIKKEKNRDKIYVYLFSRLQVYDNPDGTDVKPKYYDFTSFPESNVRQQLKGVESLNRMTKAELVLSNIETFGKYFIDGVTNVSLAFKYTIPSSETGKVDQALTKEVRLITESPSDRNRSVYDFSNMISDDAKVKALESMCQGIRTTSGGSSGVFVKVFYTDYRMDAKKLEDIKTYTTQLARNDLAIWIHLDANNKVQGELFFGPGLKERLSKDILDYYQDYLRETISLYHKISSLPIKGVAWLAGALSEVIKGTELDQKYWDPAASNYDPKVFTFFYLVRNQTTVGGGIIGRAITSDEDDFGKKIQEALSKDWQDKQYEFAFVAGLWGGVAMEASGLTDAVKMLCDAYTDPPSIEQVNSIINSILNGQAFSAIAEQLKSRYSSSQNSSFKLTYTAAKDIVAVAVLFIGVGEITGAVKASSAFAKVAEAARILDLFTLSQYAFKTVQGLRLYKLAVSSSKYFFTIIRRDTEILIRLTNEAAQILKNTDLSLFRQVAIRSADGQYIVATIFVDPAENIGNAIVQMRQLARDTYGNRVVELTESSGAKHVGVEVRDASKIVEGGDEIASLLAKLEANLPEELRAIFRSDFGNNVDVLRTIDGNPKLLESWQVLKNRPKLRVKHDELESVSKLLVNPNRIKLGLTDEVIGNIHASRLDEGSFKAIVDDLDALGNKMVEKSNIDFDNFNSLLGKLNDNNPQNSQAAHWIIQDIKANADDFVGKKWKFEERVSNSDGNAAFIDVASNEVPPKRIEYKWLTSATIGQSDFVREFIKRDLFNATDLSKIEWRIKGQKLSKEKFEDYMNSPEGKDALGKISAEKANRLLKRTDLDDISPSEIVDAFLEYFNSSSNFDLIFK
jgi:hypothetical protein